MLAAASFGSIGLGQAFLSSGQPSRHPHPHTATTSTTTTATTSTPTSTSLCSSDSDADLLQDLPFVPPEVMAKFMASVGNPLTAGSLQAGYQAGVVSEDELEEIRLKLPDPSNNNYEVLPSAQSRDTIEACWQAALEGQPWHVRTMGKLATATIVPLVAKLQEKSVQQANAMKWINENALPLIQGNATVVGLLCQSSGGSSDDTDSNGNASASANAKLVFNNTRAMYEADRGVWSASMDVFVAGSNNNNNNNRPLAEAKTEAGADASTDVSKASAALAALTEGMDEDDLASFQGSIDVLDDVMGADYDAVATTTTTTPTPTPPPVANKGIGLVNAYFVPDDEIKILVVEIDDILHNVTWKGLG